MPTTKPAMVTCVCKHHKSAHTYDPKDEGKMPPAKCTIPECTCIRFLTRQQYKQLMFGVHYGRPRLGEPLD